MNTVIPYPREWAPGNCGCVGGGNCDAAGGHGSRRAS